MARFGAFLDQIVWIVNCEVSICRYSAPRLSGCSLTSRPNQFEAIPE